MPYMVHMAVNSVGVTSYPNIDIMLRLQYGTLRSIMGAPGNYPTSRYITTRTFRTCVMLSNTRSQEIKRYSRLLDRPNDTTFLTRQLVFTQASSNLAFAHNNELASRYCTLYLYKRIGKLASSYHFLDVILSHRNI